jgi:hypothetical protein
MKYPFSLQHRNVEIAAFQYPEDAVHEMNKIGVGAVVLREDGVEIGRSVPFAMPRNEPWIH